MLVSVHLLAVACVFLRTAVAIFVDDAWNVDYHLALLGAPQEHTTFFHQPFADTKASLLYTLSEKAVLGAVNPKDGSIVWRQALSKSSNHTATSLRVGQDQDVLLSAVDGELAAFSASDGRQAWTLDLGAGTVQDLEILEIPEGHAGARTKDAIVLTDGAQPVLRRIGGADGQIKWSFTEKSGDTPFQVSASATEVFYIALHTTTLGGLKIKVVSLDPTNGHKLDEYTLSSEGELVSSEGIITVGANSASPIIAWTDKSRSVLKVNIIGTRGISSFNIGNAKDVQKISLHAPHRIDARPHFLVHYQSIEQHWADVFHVDLKKSTVSKAYSLPKLAGSGAFSASGSDANVYFTRISEAEVSVFSSASHGILARWPLSADGKQSFGEKFHPLHSVSEISVKADSVSAARSAVYLSSGDWVLIRDGTVSWERPESLSETVSAVWAYPPTAEKLIHELKAEGHSNLVQAYIHRVGRHIHDLQRLPGYLQALPQRLMHNLGLGGSSQDAVATSTDSFGYRKTIVCLTKNGRLIGLDAGDKGMVLWNTQLSGFGPGAASQTPQLLANPDGTILVKAGEGQEPRLIDAATGQDLGLTTHQRQSSSHEAAFSYSLENDVIVGGPGSGAPVWKFVARKGQHITSLTPRPMEDPVASIGKVLGDRRVLYKYLNPNVLLVSAVSDMSKSATISVLDAISGSILYSATHENVDVTRPISSTIAENWFTYSFTSETSASESAGHQLIVGELYESPSPNDRGPLGSASNTSDLEDNYEPYVIAQTYRIPEPISHMSVTQTRQGITSRLLLAVLPESNSIVGIPRSVLDPRRPVGRDPNTNEQMEGLMRYTPVLEFDPKWYLSHQREVLGIEKITTSPAVLESTSLVFAYGLDVFGTRISPSFSFDVLGKDFNKLQMVATVVALFVGTLIVAPLVQRKQINARWLFA